MYYNMYCPQFKQIIKCPKGVMVRHSDCSHMYYSSIFFPLWSSLPLGPAPNKSNSFHF